MNVRCPVGAVPLEDQISSFDIILDCQVEMICLLMMTVNVSTKHSDLSFQYQSKVLFSNYEVESRKFMANLKFKADPTSNAHFTNTDNGKHILKGR